jgi:phosphopantothenoylcysteine decarboxylase/phosphopantothenate--cysteine ligase
VLERRAVVLGVSGGVAAYKAVEVCRRMVDAGATVRPVLTRDAQRFVGAATFSAVASEPARTSLWDSPEPSPHTFLGQSADLVVVAPATARLLAAYAIGLSDDLLVATLLATRAPVVVCPAMHTEMWEQPAVQANLALLRSAACTWSSGRRPPRRRRRRGRPLAEPVDIVAACEQCCATRPRPGTSPACACSSPPVAPGSPSTRCATSRTGRRQAGPRRRRGGGPARRARHPRHAADPVVAAGIEVLRVGTAAEMERAVSSRATTPTSS